MSFTGTRTVTLKLASGRHEFYCRPHESVMNGFFTVGAGAAGGDDHGTDG